MNKSTSPKVALVYDRVNKWGGAERLLLALQKIYPQAPLFTLVHQPATAWAKSFTVIPSFFNSLPFLRSRHELLAPIAPLGFEAFNLDDFDLVITLTSSDAKAVITKPSTFHLCYCLTPTRYLWSLKHEYVDTPDLGPFSQLASRYLHKNINWLQKRDFILAQRPDSYLSISKEVAQRVRDSYQRDSQVLYPPIDFDFWSKPAQPSPVAAGKYFLVVSRLVAYKKVDLVVKTFAQKRFRDQRLLVVGTGKQADQLKALSTPNISFAGHVSDAQLRQLYRHAKALIFPQLEDFGLVPLEAQAAGTPVIAFRGGGAVETVVDTKTGLFFDQQSVASLSQALQKFSRLHFNPRTCQRHAALFDEAIFLKKFSGRVESLYETYRHRRRTG